MTRVFVIYDTTRERERERLKLECDNKEVGECKRDDQRGKFEFVMRATVNGGYK